MKLKISNKDSICKSLKQLNAFDILELEPGIYKEKVKITKPVTINGLGEVIISNCDYSPKTHKDNQEYNTFRTYTVMVASDDVIMNNVTIKNDSGDPKYFGQAVSLHVVGDRFKMRNSTIYGLQDTLFLGPLPLDLINRYDGFLPSDELVFKEMKSSFLNCKISGTVDFIFGCGEASFINCDIISLNAEKGYVTAPAHEKFQNQGFEFRHCHFRSLTINDSVYLARPWRDYGFVSFIDSTYDSHIKKEGFSNWNGSREDTARFYEKNSSIDFSQRRIVKELKDD